MSTREIKRPADSDPPRYRDYPALFWDLQPDAVVDVENEFVLARLLTQGTPEIISRLVPVSLIRRELATLPIPEHTRRFWQMFLDAMSRSGQGSRAGA